MAEFHEDTAFDVPITPAGGTNAFDPPATIDPNQLSESLGVTSEGNYLCKLPALETRGTQTDCDGHMVFADGTHIAWFGGSLYKWSGTSWAVVTGGNNMGTPGKRWSMAVFGDKCYMTNGTDKPLVYDKSTNTLSELGITSPVSYIRLGFAWSDEYWTNSTFDTTVYDPTKPDKEGEIKRSIKVSVGGSSVTVGRTVNQSLSSFPNGYSIQVSDWFSFWIRHLDHTVMPDVPLSITLSTSNGNYVYYVNKNELTVNEWGEITNNHQNLKVSRLRIRLDNFTHTATYQPLTSVPATLSNVTFNFYTGTGPNEFHLDHIKLEPAPPAVVPQARIFGSPATKWAGDAGVPQYGGIGVDPWPLVDTDSVQISFTAPGTKSVYKTIPAGFRDYTVWDDDVREPISDSDIIYFAFYITKGASLGTVTVRITYGSAGAYSQVDVTSQISKADYSLSRVEIRRSQFTGVDWSDVREIRIYVTYNSSVGSQVIISNLHMAPGSYVKEFLDTEATPTGAFVKELNIKPAGFNNSWRLQVTGTGGVTGEWPIATAKRNLNEFSTGVASDAYDHISFWMHHAGRAKIREVECRVVDSSGNTASYVIPQEGLAGTKLKGSGSVIGNNVSSYYSLQKRRFQGGQSTAVDWGNIVKILFILKGAKKRGTANVYIQDVKMERAPHLSGSYHWKVRYVGEGVDTDVINTVWYSRRLPRLDAIPLKGQSALLVGIRTPPSGTANRLEVWRLRLGDGSYGREAVVTKTGGSFPAKVTVGRVNEEDLEGVLEETPRSPLDPEGSSAPRGQYNYFNGASHWVWGVTAYPNQVFFAPDFQPYAFSATNSLLFASKVMAVVVMYNAVFVFTELGIKRVAQGRVYHYDLNEIPAWDRAVTKLSGGYMAFANRDNVYLFDGSVVTPIGFPLRGLLRQANTVELGTWGDHLVVAIATPDGAETWTYYLRSKTWHRWCQQFLKAVVDRGGEMFAIGESGMVVRAVKQRFVDTATAVTAHLFSRELRRSRLDKVVVLASGDGVLTVVPMVNGKPLEDASGFAFSQAFTLTPHPQRFTVHLSGIAAPQGNVVVGLGDSFAIKLILSGSMEQAYIYSLIVSGHKVPGDN